MHANSGKIAIPSPDSAAARAWERLEKTCLPEGADRKPAGLDEDDAGNDPGQRSQYGVPSLWVKTAPPAGPFLYARSSSGYSALSSGARLLISR